MLDALLQTLRLSEATVTHLTDGGDVQATGEDGSDVSCRLLQMADAAPLTLTVGDRVLVAAAPSDGRGYVLGRVAPHRAEPAPGASPGTVRTVEIVAPEGVESIRLSARRIALAADESVSIECGGASVRIDRRGKVVVLGSDITSRAKRLHKIKGASVAIN